MDSTGMVTHTYMHTHTYTHTTYSVEGQPDEYISRFTLPELGTTCQYGTRTRWSGMIHSEQIVHLITKAKCVHLCVCLCM